MEGERMISEFIRKLRENRNLSQESLSAKLGMSRQTYGLIEKGRRDLTIDEARKLADIFGLSIEDFLKERDRHVVVDVECDKRPAKIGKPEMRVSIPQKNLDKFKEVLLYILTKVGGKPNVGETVLYKLLYFIDFDFYEKYEEQLIGATYIKNHHGPTPVEFSKLIEQAVSAGEIEVVKSKYFDFDQKKYLAIREPDLTKLKDARELKHIDDVLARLSDYNASELSVISHNDIPWIIADNLQPIDYEAVFYRTPDTSVRHYDEQD